MRAQSALAYTRSVIALMVGCGAVGLVGGLPHAAYAAPTATPIVSPDQAADGFVMNYAVNLDSSATASQFDALVAAADGIAQSAHLRTYPEFKTFFAQSAKSDFATQLAAAAQAAGIPVHSIGQTRTSQVTGAEVVVSTASSASSGSSGSPGLSVHTPGEALRAAARVLNQTQVERLNGAAANSRSAAVAADPSTDWNLKAIGAVDTKKYADGLAPVTVGVIDSGVEGDHPELVDVIDASKSFGCQVNGYENHSYSAWQDDNGHGTHVAGTIAAKQDGLKAEGIAPNATIVAIKASSSEGFFYPEYVACAFVGAINAGVKVTNNSYYVDPWAYWLDNEPTQAAGYESVRRVVAYSWDHDILNLAAAGNSNVDTDNPTVDSESPNDTTPVEDRPVAGGHDIPSTLPGVVDVSAVTMTDSTADPATQFLVRSEFSNYGAKRIDVAAPGSSIYSTYSKAVSGRDYDFLSGTSMASPHATGVATLLRGAHPTYSAAQVADLLKNQASAHYDRLKVDPEGKEYRGHGLISALDAITKDVEAATLSSIEYSADGGATWQPLTGDIAAEEISIRATLTGRVSSATLTVDGMNPVTVTADGLGAAPVVVEIAHVTPRGATTGGLRALVSASGPFSALETDDATGEADATLVMPQETGDPTAPATETPASDAPAQPNPKAAGKKNLAATGMAGGVLGGAALAALAGLGLTLRRRSL